MTTAVNATLAGNRPFFTLTPLGALVGNLGAGAKNLFSGATNPDAVIEALFANNEVGAWYDPSDLSTMFQDSSGTTPVTADGQPVGLILDKSKGLVLGSELALNPEFTSSDDWFFGGANWSISGGALIGASPPSYCKIINAGAATAGKWYKVTVVVKSRSSGGVSPRINNVQSATASGAAGTYTWYICAGSVVSGITDGFHLVPSWPFIGEIESASFKELPGNHASQATTASRPLYKTDGTYSWLQFDGVDDSLSTTAINFTGTDKMSMFSGVMRNNNTVGFIYEFSSTFSSNNGAFNLLSGTDGVTTNGYTFKTRGDVNTTIGARVNDVGSPVKSVISTSGDILADLTTIRVNTIAGINGTQDQGAGNFGTYPLYIASRAGNSVFINGNIYSLIVRDALSTTQEITDTETWVNGKTGAF